MLLCCSRCDQRVVMGGAPSHTDAGNARTVSGIDIPDLVADCYDLARPGVQGLEHPFELRRFSEEGCARLVVVNERRMRAEHQLNIRRRVGADHRDQYSVRL